MDNRDKLVDLLLLANETASISGRELDTDEVNDLADFLDINDVVVQRWISVEERLPERETAVLCLFRHPDITTVCQNYHYDNGHWLSDGNLVTHWMPLPKPPMEG